LLEEPADRPQVAPWRHEYVDDLPVLIDGPVDVAPAAGDLPIGLVDLPTIPTRCRQDRAASASSGVNRCTDR
jgi:hypothetical protein